MNRVSGPERDNMPTCPIHGTPLNANRDCLPCDISSGMFDANFEPGTSEETQHEAMKSNALEREARAIKKALTEIEAHEQ